MRRERRPRPNREVLAEFPLRRPNGQGGNTKYWSDPTPIWAEMQPLRGQNAIEHQLQRARQLWKVTTRWREDLTSECRLVFEGKPLAIIGEPADPDGRRRWLVMTCESGVKT